MIHCTGWITALAPLYLKKIYNGDPSFTDARVVFSLFDHPFEGTLDPRMLEKLLPEGFTADDLHSLDYIALNKIAIDYADAIAISSPGIPDELVEYARASGKPLLEHPGDENYAEAYKTFYQSL